MRIDMEFDRDTRDFRFPVEFVLYRDVLPARIARADKSGKPIDADELYARAIEKRGLRAQPGKPARRYLLPHG